MPNRVDRILESIKTNAGNGAYKRIIGVCGILDEKTTPGKQSTYVKSVLSELENICVADVVAGVMKPCGYQCVSNNIVARAMDLHAESDNLENFLRLLNAQRIGGGKLHITGGKIIGVYERCYCGLAKSVKELSPLYCYCSAGWYERLFSSIFEKPIEVKIVQTILDGSDMCVFEISY
jgi:predicted hydrocarbon binding protein